MVVEGGDGGGEVTAVIGEGDGPNQAEVENTARTTPPTQSRPADVNQSPSQETGRRGDGETGRRGDVN